MALPGVHRFTFSTSVRHRWGGVLSLIATRRKPCVGQLRMLVLADAATASYSAWCCWTADFAWAQSDQANQHIHLPPAFGGTALSFHDSGRSGLRSRLRDMVESVARARKINAEAVAMEIQNSIDYVDAYFKRRELNREWRAKEEPNYLESEKRRQAVFKRKVENNIRISCAQLTSADTLNWLLRELSPRCGLPNLPPDRHWFTHSLIARSPKGTWNRSGFTGRWQQS